MRIILYARVSTEEQGTQGVSLAAQLEKMRGYASLYDLTVADEIQEAGASGKSLQRPGLQRALEALRNREADGILVAKLDRITRSVSDMAQLIKLYFGEAAQHPSSLLSVSDQIDTRSAAGRLVLNILVSVSEWERETISERTKTALHYKIARGEHVGCVPFGFEIKEKVLTPHDQEVFTVTRIRDMRTGGLTLREIADRLNQDGTRTRRQAQWVATSVKRVLDRHR